MSTPKQQWPITQALIYSVDWFQPSRNDEGHYDVVYSYKVGEERFTGQFSDYYRGDSPLHANDTISIRYCPEHPAKSYYPDGRPPIFSRWILFAVLIGSAVVSFIACLIYRHH